MHKPLNPFHKWLGLKPGVKNPHHFQLLGVSARLTDSEEIKNAVAEGVAEKLALLAKVPVNEKTAPFIEKLKTRIAVAQKTLSDPVLRKAYKSKLKSQLEAAKAKKSSKQSVTQNAPAISASELLPPKTSPAIAQPVTAIESGPMPQPELSEPAIPGAAIAPPAVPPIPAEAPSIPAAQPAVPLAVPLSGDQAPPAVAVAVTPSAPENDELSAVTIQRNRRTKKKSNKLVAPVMFLSMLGVGGIGAYLIYDNFDALMKLGKVDPEEVKMAPGIVDDNQKDSKPEDKEEYEKLKAVDLDSIPELDVDEVMGEAIGTGRTPEEEKAWAKKLAEREGRNGIESPLMGEKPDPMSKPEMEPSDVDPKDLVLLNESQLARIRRSSERAHRSIYRRDFELAEELLSWSEQIGNESGADISLLTPKHRNLVQNVSDSREVIDLVKGFWKQVHDSAETTAGAQELVVGTQIVAFVESKPNSVILRRQGGNIEYDYKWCPPGLALAIAEQGAVPDVPTWNKQQAAMLAVDQVAGNDHGNKIDELLKVAESANHDCTGIRRFADFDFGKLGLPPNKIETPNPDEPSEAVKQFRNDVGYDNVAKLDPEKAIQHAQLLLKIDSPNFEQQVSILQEAKSLAIVGGSASLAQDALMEIGKYTNEDLPSLTTKSFELLSEGKRERENVRDLMERAIPFLNSIEAESVDKKSKTRLVKQLSKLADKFGMPDAGRRLGQIEF